jgi:hypothetical protein
MKHYKGPLPTSHFSDYPLAVDRASLAGFGVAALLTAGLASLAVSLAPPPPPRWTVTGRVSAYRALVMHVETPHLDEALMIAREIGNPILDRYTEILIFFHRPGKDDMARRIQWTRAHGYVQTIY